MPQTRKEDLVLYETKGHVAILTLNRPRAMNAVSEAVSERIESLIERFEADDNLWVAIIASSHPRVFCAGADLKSLNRGENVSTEDGGFAGLVNKRRTKPLIAAVDGFALAGGCEIVLACDLVVASRVSKFGVPEVKRSLVAAAGGLFRLPRRLPRNIAMEMNLTGDPIDAQRMRDFGFVNILCDKGRVLQEALKLAQRITVNAPLAVREAKKAVDGMSFMSDDAAFQASNEAILRLMMTPGEAPACPHYRSRSHISNATRTLARLRFYGRHWGIYSKAKAKVDRKVQAVSCPSGFA